MAPALRAIQAALLVLLVLQAGGCAERPAGTDVPRPSAIEGAVQKGPFIRGTTVTVQELDDDLRPTGRSFDVATTDDLGGFTVPVHLSSRFIEVIATGYYYNELLDQLSPGPLTLRAVSDVLTDGTVNVNLLTSMSAPLIRGAVARGETFAAARQESESSVLDALGFTTRNRLPFDKLDVASPGDDDAVLLAASLVIERYAELLGDSEVAQLTQLLSQIGAALSDGGSAGALTGLRDARCSIAESIDAAAVRRNLTAHYATFGVVVAIPPFEAFVDAANCADAGVTDAGVTDAGVTDASVTDASVTDASADAPVLADASPGDAAFVDGSVSCRPPSFVPAYPGSFVYGMAEDVNGDFWFADYANDRVSRVTQGSTYTVSIPKNDAGGTAGLEGLVIAPDHSVWFAENVKGKIGKITPCAGGCAGSLDAGSLDEFDLPTSNAGPTILTVGSDGNVWFAEASASKIGVIGVDGAVTEFALADRSSPFGVTLGPDGNVWFAESGARKIGRITLAGDVKEYAVPNAPLLIVGGPDGNLWFTEGAASKIGRITPAGVVTEFSTATPNASPLGITAGRDGNLWFTENTSTNIGRITPTGVVTEFPVGFIHGYLMASGPTGQMWAGAPSGVVQVNLDCAAVPADAGTGDAGTGIEGGGGVPPLTLEPGPPLNGVITWYAVPFKYPEGITTGADGNLWFTMDQDNKIGRITPTGVISTFDVPTPTSQPTSLTQGSDGNVWFVEINASKIGKITPAGVITDYPTPSVNSAPSGITLGPDGNVWFTEQAADRLARITPSGAITEFPLPSTNTMVAGITTGPDGNLWFCEYGLDQIGSMTPLGVVTEYPLPTTSSYPTAITTAGGLLWFTAANRIGTMSSSGIREYAIGPSRQLTTIMTGPDGALWFPGGRLTTDGKLSLSSLIGGQSMTAGPDGRIWFADYFGLRIGAYSP